jgi:hypothetical protein
MKKAAEKVETVICGLKCLARFRGVFKVNDRPCPGLARIQKMGKVPPSPTKKVLVD